MVSRAADHLGFIETAPVAGISDARRYLSRVDRSTTDRGVSLADATLSAMIAVSASVAAVELDWT
jgi:hypothetical protein